MFCALTNDEEANILSAMLAKRLGARKVMSLINRASYVDLVESETIDVAISPQQATIGSLLTHIMRCAGVPRRQSKRLPMVLAITQKWLAGRLMKSNCHPVPLSAPSCVARKSSLHITIP